MSLSAQFDLPPLQELVLLQLAKNLCGIPIDQTPLGQWENRLVNHRERVINNFGDIKIHLPTRLKISIKESIILLYQSYRRILIWKRKYDLDNRIDFLKEGELYAPNYITVDGDFNDLVWTKRFVGDPSNRPFDRFSLACHYRFEEETKALWPELKSSGVAPFLGDLDSIQQQLNPLVALRVYELENRLVELAQHWNYEGSSFREGFRISARDGYEHAVYYFWQKLSESEKQSILQNNSIFNLMCESKNDTNDKSSYFLYSQLSEVRKTSFLRHTVGQYFQPNLHKCFNLLISPYAHSVRSEILKFLYEINIRDFSGVLRLLTDRIKELKIPSDTEIFHILWGHISEGKRMNALYNSDDIMRNLVEAKEFYTLASVIKGLLIEDRDTLLLANCSFGQVISNLKRLCQQREFDLIERFLSLFLFKTDPVTKKEILREDTSVILEKFIASPHVQEWRNAIIPRANEVEVGKRIESLQVSSAVLYELCEEVSKETSIYRTL